MNVADANERRTLTERFRALGFKGNVFGTNKKSFTFSNNARKFVRTKIIEGKGGLIPSGMIYDTTTNQIVRDTEVLRKRDAKRRGGRSGAVSLKLQKRYERLGLKFDKRTQSILPSASTRARVGGLVKVQIEKVNPRTGQPYVFEKTFELSTPFKKDGEWKNSLVQEVNRRLDETGSDIVILKIEIGETEFFPKTGQVSTKLDSIRLRKIFLRIDGMEEQTWDTRKNKCVLDFLEWYYMEDPKISKELLYPECYDMCFEKEYLTDGISTIEIENWCKMAQVKMIALDEDYKLIRLFKPHIPSKAKVLIYIIKNKHIHPVVDKTKIRSICEIYSSNEMTKGKSAQVKKIIEEEREKNDKLPLTIIKPEERGELTNLQYLCYLMVQNKIDVIGKRIDWGKSGPESFILNERKYIFYNTSNDPVKEFIEYKGGKYKGEKCSKFVYEAMKNFEIVISKPNSIVNEIFNHDNMKDITHQGGVITKYDIDRYYDCDFSQFNWSLVPEAITLDINGCHTHILQNPLEDWITIDFTAQVEKFIDFGEDTVPLGLYFVETDDRKLFCGNKFYPSSMVNLALVEGIINKKDIKRQLLATGTLPKDYFHGLFEEYRKMGDESEAGKKFIKLLNCTTSGILGKTKYHIVKKWITTDIEQAYNYLVEHHDEEVFILPIKFDYKQEEYKMWCYGIHYKSIKENNNFCIYNQILAQQSIYLYKFIKESCNNDWERLLYRRTDAFTIKPFEKNYEKFLGTELGELKIIENPTIPRNQPYKDAEIDWRKYDRDWVVYDKIKSSNDYEEYFKLIKEGKSLMTTGEGGSGKSYVINKIKENFNALLLAFTNVASLNIQGNTIHKTFKYDDENGTISRATLQFFKQNTPDVIIIDEDEIISGYLWKVIYEVKRQLKIPFMLFGDWCQLKSIDKFRYNNHQIIKSLCDYNITEELEYHEFCRMDKELRCLIAPLRKEGKDNISRDEIVSQFKIVKRIRDLPLCNIVLSNNYKNKLNKDMNDYHYAKYQYYSIPAEINSLVEEYYPKTFTEKRPFVRFKAHVDMPIICIKNNYDIREMKNGQRYTISEIITLDGEKWEMPETPEGIKEEYEKVFGKKTDKRNQINTMKKELMQACMFGDVKFKIKVVKTGSESIISLLDLVLNFDMGYACTNHKIIGVCLKDFCIHQVRHEYAENDWLYTAFSRGTKMSDVKVCEGLYYDT